MTTNKKKFDIITIIGIIITAVAILSLFILKEGSTFWLLDLGISVLSIPFMVYLWIRYGE